MTQPTVMAPWRERLYDIIFEADTPAGKLFDVTLLIAIAVSVLLVILESVQSFQARAPGLFNRGEWILTILFTIEYGLRLICVRRPIRYMFSFFGIVDLLAILPTYLSLLFVGADSLLVIRALRLLRVFRVFKLGRFLAEGTQLMAALRSSWAKIVVFLSFVGITVVIMATAMHLVEYQARPEGLRNEGFENIPQSIYWAIVTLTTVGYGDATPLTTIGKMLAAIMMLIGYSLIIVPTGILTAELTQKAQRMLTTQTCPECLREGHDRDASHCKYCGSGL